MVFQLQKISNYGTSTPAVARTLLQGSEILMFFSSTDEQRKAAEVVLYDFQRHLLRCVEVKDRIASEINVGKEQVKKNGFEFQSNGRAVTLPGVPDLQSSAESFLQSAKLAIRETARLFEPFYKVRHDHRFRKLITWAEKEFKKEDVFTQVIREWEPWVKRIVDMRNAVDHPADRPGGKLLTQNFRLSGTQEKPVLVDPTWSLSGEPESIILQDLDAIIESIIVLGEDILIGLFCKLKIDFPLVIVQIPTEERDPCCPIRLRVTLPQDAPAPE